MRQPSFSRNGNQVVSTHSVPDANRKVFGVAVSDQPLRFESIQPRIMVCVRLDEFAATFECVTLGPAHTQVKSKGVPL